MSDGTSSSRIAVVGAGVVGLAIARRLARDGHQVTVFDAARAGRGASWAAGGMLSPLAEAVNTGAFLELALASMALWDDFAGEVERSSGHPIDYHRDGKLLVAFDDGEASLLRARYDWQRAAGHPVRWLDGEESRVVEPGLAEGVLAALHLPSDARVDPRRLASALVGEVGRLGVELLEETPVRQLAYSGTGAVSGVRTDRGLHEAEGVVLAAGAWTPDLLGRPPLPVKGQMLELRPSGRPVRALVADGHTYLIPRETERGYRVVVGATMEDAGFDLSTTDEAIDGLHRRAGRAVPELAAAERTGEWAGIRPGTADDLPVLGPDPERPGLVHAHGHHRNGVLLTPISAEWVVRWVAGEAPMGCEPFAPTRCWHREKTGP